MKQDATVIDVPGAGVSDADWSGIY